MKMAKKKKAVKAAPEKPQAQRLLEAARKAQGELRESRFAGDQSKRAQASIGRKPIKLGGGD
jgi:hypothetical protein